MHFALVYGGMSALALATFAWRLWRATRDPRNPALWAVAFAIIFVAIGFEAAVPRVYTEIATVTGVANLASLIVYGSIASALLAQTMWTTFMVVPGGDHTVLRRSSLYTGALAAGTLIVMTVLFAAAPVHDAVHAIDFDFSYATVPLADAFLGVYLLVYSAALIHIIRLCRAWIPQITDQRWLRRGLRLLGIGAVIALGYSVGKTIAIVGAWCGARMYLLNVTVAPEFASLGSAVMLLGYLTPSVVPALLGTASRARAHRRLRPLWAALREIAPEMVAAATNRSRHRNRLYRRVIEIRDWMLRLRPYLPNDTDDIAARLADSLEVPPSHRGAAIEAARIAVALRARRDNRPALQPDNFREPEQPTLAGELAWLAAVAQAYVASPLVPAVLAETERAAR
jgi:hypothetical protein